MFSILVSLWLTQFLFLMGDKWRVRFKILIVKQQKAHVLFDIFMEPPNGGKEHYSIWKLGGELIRVTIERRLTGCQTWEHQQFYRSFLRYWEVLYFTQHHNDFREDAVRFFFNLLFTSSMTLRKWVIFQFIVELSTIFFRWLESELYVFISNNPVRQISSWNV